MLEMKFLKDESPHNQAMGRIQYLANRANEYLYKDAGEVRTCLQEIFTVANEQWEN